MAALLTAGGVCTFYGGAQVLFDLDLEVGEREAVVLLGRNGAGKTTTLRTLMGLVPPAAGRIVFAGEDITGAAPHRVARLGLGWVPEERRIFGDLDVEENLEVGRRPAPAGRAPWTKDALIELFPALAGLGRRRGCYLSGGEQQMLAIARTLMGNPKLVLLDEPSEGLAPLVVQALARAARTMTESGTSLLICEQNLAFARAVADRAYVVEGGRVRWRGAMAELAADAAARRRWLAV